MTLHELTMSVRAVVTALDMVSVRGRENMDTVLGSIQTLDRVAAELAKRERAEAEAAEKAKAEATDSTD